MKVDGVHYRTIWWEEGAVRIIDQTRLPHAFEIVTLSSLEDACRAIRTMQVRGAPLIGAAAAYGLALGLRADPSDEGVGTARERLLATRPTAVNLRWALDRAVAGLASVEESARADTALRIAGDICEEDVELNRRIGEHALDVLRGLARSDATQVLTHCNAGWLATVDRGTATSGIYAAHEAGLPLHVWVDETRPRLQGARLTAWELGSHGVPHTVVPDGAAAHLLATGRVDLVIVGTDRTTAAGDVVNKIGTYGIALAARDNGVPFYVAAPSPSIDWTLADGREVPIEERSADEVLRVSGRTDQGEVARVRITPEASPAANFAFDVTPARLVTGIITERGIATSDEGLAEGLRRLFPER
jgi:methylthioribose-1-phosphate isomerase